MFAGMEALLADSRLGAGPKLLYLHCWDACGGRPDRMDFQAGRLARKLGCDGKTVGRWFAALRTAGLVAYPEPNRGWFRCLVYQPRPGGSTAEEAPRSDPQLQIAFPADDFPSEPAECPDRMPGQNAEHLSGCGPRNYRSQPAECPDRMPSCAQRSNESNTYVLPKSQRRSKDIGAGGDSPLAQTMAEAIDRVCDPGRRRAEKDRIKRQVHAASPTAHDWLLGFVADLVLDCRLKPTELDTLLGTLKRRKRLPADDDKHIAEPAAWLNRSIRRLCRRRAIPFGANYYGEAAREAAGP